MVIPLGERYEVFVQLDSPAAAAEFIARIEEAIAAHHAHASGDAVTSLARGRMPVRVWLRALRAIGTGANATLRIPQVPRDQLWSVLEDAAATPSDRAAAVWLQCTLSMPARYTSLT